MITGARFLVRYFEEIVSGTLLILIWAAASVGIVSRYFLSSPIPWTEEFARYAFIWLTFMGAAACTKQYKHLAIEAAVVLLPERAQSYCRIVADAATAGLMPVIIYYGWLLTAAATQPTSTLKVPVSVVYVVVPISGALIFVHSVRDLLLHVREHLAERRRYLL